MRAAKAGNRSQSGHDSRSVSGPGAGPAACGVPVMIRQRALVLRPRVERRLVILTPLVGLAVAGLAIAFAAATGKSSSEVLFSDYSVGALLLTLKGPTACGLRPCCARANPLTEGSPGEVRHLAGGWRRVA